MSETSGNRPRGPATQLPDVADVDDDALFREAMGDVQPLTSKKARDQAGGERSDPTVGQLQRQKDAVTERDAEGEERIMTLGEVLPVDPQAVLAWKQDGVQQGVFDKLRKGEYPVEAQLDLHHKTVKEARIALWAFLRDAQENGWRCVSVAHGRGERSPTPARLKSFVRHWLTGLPLAIAFHSALARHGGTGATYVLVQKSKKAKSENRELHGGRAEG